MEPVDRLAARLDAASAAVEDAAAGMGGLWHDASVFGGDAPGLLGEAGRALHRQWTAALCDREREARHAAALLAETAAALRRTVAAYTSADETVAGDLAAAYPDGGGAP